MAINAIKLVNIAREYEERQSRVDYLKSCLKAIGKREAHVNSISVISKGAGYYMASNMDMSFITEVYQDYIAAGIRDEIAIHEKAMGNLLQDIKKELFTESPTDNK